MDYSNIISRLEESRYLISMTPVERIVELGFDSGMNARSRILDLCCGYGKMLSIWREAFGACGVGVDISREFIDKGRALLAQKNIDGVELVCEDVLRWKTDEKFDFVCLSGEDFGGFAGTIDLLGRYARPDGKLVIGTRYSKTENPPRALVDFEGETLSLRQMNRVVRDKGYYITAMATGTDAEWERYIMWSARRNLAALRNAPNEAGARAWCDRWYDTYFDFRRQCEGYVTMVIERL